jgi:hypothetical protein
MSEVLIHYQKELCHNWALARDVSDVSIELRHTQVCNCRGKYGAGARGVLIYRLQQVPEAGRSCVWIIQASKPESYGVLVLRGASNPRMPAFDLVQ